LVVKVYAVAKISQIYCWGIFIWATLYCIPTTKFGYSSSGLSNFNSQKLQGDPDTCLNDLDKCTPILKTIF